MIGTVAAGFVQLHSQFRQFPGMGSIVARHILHQCQQFLHRFQAVGRIVVVIVIMEVLLGMVMVMPLLMMVGMAVLVMMFVGMGMSVMGMRMGMGMEMIVAVSADMVMGNVHGFFSPFICFRILQIPVCGIDRQFSGG